MSPQEARRRFRKGAGMVDRRIGDEFVIVPVRRSVDDPSGIFQLNPVASFIWERLASGRALGELLDDLVDTFEVDETKAEADLLELVAKLEQVEAIEPVGEPVAS